MPGSNTCQFAPPTPRAPRALLALFPAVSWGLDLDRLESRNPHPPSSHIVLVTHQHDRWILTSEGGFLTHSADAESWSTVTLPDDKTIVDVIHWQGRYLAAGADSRILLASADLVNWTRVPTLGSAFPFNPRKFQSAFGKLFVVGASPALAASDDGETWDEVDLPLDHPRPEGMATNGSRAVIVGNDGLILSSDDGLAWARRDSPLPPELTGIEDDFLVVRWVNDRFVAGGKEGLLASSPDGLHWTHHPTAFADWLHDVVFDGDHYAFPGRQGRIRLTPDLESWTEVDLGTLQNWLSLARASDRIVVGGRDGFVAHRDPGETWTLSTVGPREWFSSLAYGADVFLAADANGGIWKSNDTEAWIRVHQTPDAAAVQGLSWDGERFLGMSGDGRLLTSPDGDAWTTGPQLLTRRVEGFFRANGFHWAVGADGLVARSGDLVGWTEQTLANHRFHGLSHGDGLHLLVGRRADFSRAVLFTSPDGTSWTERDPGFPAESSLRLQASAYGNGRHVAGGNGYSLTTSTDGLVWSHDATPGSTPFNLNRLRFVDDQFIGLGSSGTIYLSSDGLNWTPRRLRTTRPLFDLLVAGGRTVVAGGSGTLFSTSLDLGNTYAAWMAERFTPAQQADPAFSAPERDPDGDGRTNAFEFFSNTPPLVPNAGPPYRLETIVSGGQTYPGFSIRRARDLAGASLRVWRSTTLSSWSELTGSALVEVSVTPLDAGTDLVRFRSAEPVGASAANFLRVEVILE
jgi:photosystem II stability/assembly factor-like uncharacterized protein